MAGAWKRGFWAVFAASAVMLWCHPAHAIDLKSALERGVARSEKILAAKAAYDKARMERNAAMGAFGPGMTLEGSKLWLDVHSTIPETKAPALSPEAAAALTPELLAVFEGMFSSFDFSSLTAVPDHSDTLTLSAYQPLTPLIQIGYYNAMARDAREIARLSWELTNDNIGLLVASAYFNVLNAEKAVKTYEEASQQMALLLKDAQALSAQGMMTSADRLKFEMRARDVDVQLEQSRQNLAMAKSTLAKLLDMPVAEAQCADIDLDLREPKDLEYYMSEGAQNRPELQIAALTEKAARSARAAAYLDMVPTVSAIASAEWNDDGLDTTPDRTYAAGLALSWNFWAWGTRYHKARAADYARAEARHQANDAGNDVLLSIEKAWRDDVMAHRMVQALGLTVQQAQENYRIENNRFKAGKSTATELMSAQIQSTSAQASYHATRYGTALADAALLIAIGQSPFPDLMGGSQP